MHFWRHTVLLQEIRVATGQCRSHVFSVLLIHAELEAFLKGSPLMKSVKCLAMASGSTLRTTSVSKFGVVYDLALPRRIGRSHPPPVFSQRVYRGENAKGPIWRRRDGHRLNMKRSDALKFLVGELNKIAILGLRLFSKRLSERVADGHGEGRLGPFSPACDGLQQAKPSSDRPMPSILAPRRPP